MSFDDRLTRRLERLQKWSDRCSRLLDAESSAIEELYRKTLADLENRKMDAVGKIEDDEARIKGEIDQAGKDYSQNKYRLERETATTKADLERLQTSYREFKKRFDEELRTLNEEKTNLQISHDRQVRALRELYDEKKRSLAVAQAGLARQWQEAEARFRTTRERYEKEIAALSAEGEARVAQLKEQAAAKRQGWDAAVEALRRQRDALLQEKAETERRVASVREENEKELYAVQTAMAVAREQLEVDRASIVERAEDDQRRCEADLNDLKEKLALAEREFQELVVRHEQAKKDEDEACRREETSIRDAVKAEGEKRDVEQKIFEQEKAQLEKELVRLREDYEKKKWQWDNQVRALAMQKTLQESEHEGEKLSTDREARQVLRGLEAKRDELKQRLADVKSRTNALIANGEKEMDLLRQRWNWRRERLWSLWQSRLETLRKERAAVQEEIDALRQMFASERQRLEDRTTAENDRIAKMQEQVLTSGERDRGHKKQREIQFELEKTRLYAQIRECETHLSEWMDRFKQVDEETGRSRKKLLEQVQDLERWYREEEQETRLFLQVIQDTAGAIERFYERTGIEDAA